MSNIKLEELKRSGLELNDDILDKIVGGNGEEDHYLWYYGGVCPNCGGQDTKIVIDEFDTHFREVTECYGCGNIDTGIHYK